MSDPSTLLLLTCATCLGNTPSPAQTAIAMNSSCVQPGGEVKDNQSVASSSNCISPPEAIATSPSFRLIAQSTSPESATPVLRVGSQGEAVTRLQTKLQQLGYYSGSMDGRYSLQLKAAVSKFQKAKGLSADGITGSLTWEQLASSSSQSSQSVQGSKGTQEQSSTQTGNQLINTSSSSSSPSIATVQQSNLSPSPKAEESQSSPVTSEPSPDKNLQAQSPATGGETRSQPDMSSDFVIAQSQLLWLLGGAILFTGGVVVFLLLNPSGNKEGLKLEAVGNNVQSADFPYPISTETTSLTSKKTPPGNGNEPDKELSSRDWGLMNSGEFDQSIILRQSPLWLQLIIWGIVGVTSFTVIWACVAQVDEAIPAQGKLEPQGTVNNIQAPVGGVVKDVFVKEGQSVKAGDLLISFDQTAAQAELKSLESIRAALLKENEVYRRQMRGDTSVGDIKLPSDLLLLTQNRGALVAENQLYQLQIYGGAAAKLSPEQQQRLQSAQSELTSRVAATELVVRQLEKQLSQNQIALVNARKILATNQEILDGIAPLVKEGAIARVQFLNQQQEVNTRQAEVDRLIQEAARLELEIAEAKEKLQNTVSGSRQDLFVKIDDNKKRIAEIDSQLTKAIVENEKRLAEIDSQLSQTKQTLRYQDLRAPVNGTVFDLQATNPGFVANSSEPILKIVPNDSLIAEIYITNQHIGFVKPGMQVDVRTDTFPYSEFGDIKGELVTIGSDALPPDQVYPFYRFPAKIRLEKQSIVINNREVPLQSGMSVSANIKVRKRTIMSIFTNLLSQKLDTIKTVR